MSDVLPQRAVTITVAAATDPGRRRAENQDHYLVADLSDRDPDHALAEGGEGHNGVSGPTGLAVRARGALLMVADGMGGAAGGATASAMACRGCSPRSGGRSGAAPLATSRATWWPRWKRPTG